jgi:hypothetical protein
MKEHSNDMNDQPPNHFPSNNPPPYPSQFPQYPPQNATNPPPYSQGYPPPFPQQVPNYIPPGYVPIPPPKKGLKVWQWVLIGASGVLLLCCAGGAIIAVATNSSTTTTGQHNDSSNNAPPTAIPPLVINRMALGKDYKRVGEGFVIVTPKVAFSANDTLAFAITLDHAIGTTQAQILLVRLESGGVESTVFSQNMPISNPDFNEFANRIKIGTIMSAYGQSAGKFRLELSDGHAVVAKADFTYRP